MALIAVSLPGRWCCCHMDKSRNTGDVVHQVSSGCTGIYLGFVLQPRHHHLVALLGNVHHRRWYYHHPMLQWGTALWWVWCGDTSHCVLKMKYLLPWGLEFWHWHWNVGCIIYWVSQDSHHHTWWIPGGGMWGCGICVCEVRTLHAALEF